MSMELLSDGAIVSVMGMSMVFAFLVILVCSMHVMAVVMRYLNTKFPEAIPETAAPKRQNCTNDDSAVALAIAAVMAYQNK